MGRLYKLKNTKLAVAIPGLVPSCGFFLDGLVNTNVHIALESTQQQERTGIVAT